MHRPSTCLRTLLVAGPALSLGSCKPFFGTNSSRDVDSRPALRQPNATTPEPGVPTTAKPASGGHPVARQNPKLSSDRRLSDFETAELAPKKCSAAPGLKRVSVPVDHDRPDGPKTDYAYQLLRGTRAGLIVHIPGGPGGDLVVTDNAESETLVDYYHGYSAMMIDPRGVGCNATMEELDLGTLTTYQHARDVVAAVKDSGQENFILWGSSYGTVAATVAAHLAESVGLKPRAVILEGVLGGVANDRQEFPQVWDWIRKEVPGAARVAASVPSWMGASEEEFLRIVLAGATADPRKLRDGIALAVDAEAAPDELTRELWKNLLESAREESTTPDVKGSDAFYAAVACREIWSSIPNEAARFDHDGILGFVPSSGGAKDFCASKGLSLVDPYEPADYAVATPIYYFQGSRDPNTPLAGARKHYEKFKASGEREFVEIADGGHGPLTLELLDCRHDLLARIFKSEKVRPVLDDEGRCRQKAVGLTTPNRAFKPLKGALRAPADRR